MSDSDFHLLQRWQQHRDAEAFQELAHRYARLVFAAAHRILGNTHDAEDVAQQSFITLAQTRHPPKSHVGAWLHRVAVNHAKNQIRHAQRRTARDTRYAESLPKEGAQNWEDIFTHVDAAIAALPEAERRVIVAHFLEGRSQAEIAASLGVTRQAVSLRTQKAIENTRRILGKRGVLVPLAVLQAALASPMAEAAPPALTASIGRLALSGALIPASGGIFASIAAMLTLKPILAGCSALLVLFALTWNAPHHPARPQIPTVTSNSPAAAPQAAPAVPASAPAAEPATGSTIIHTAVLDSAGQPWAGNATIRFHINHDGLKSGHRSRGVREIPNPNASDEQPAHTGRFELEENASILLCAFDERAHLISPMVRIDSRPGETLYVDLPLGMPASVTGQLLDHVGEPVSDCSVRLSLPNTDQDWTAAVDTHGRYAFDMLPGAAYHVEAGTFDAPSDAERQYTLRLEESELVLADGEQRDWSVRALATAESVTGRVVDERGIPVPGMQLQATLANIPTVVELGFIAQTLSGPKGEFRLNVFAPDEYNITSSDPACRIDIVQTVAGAQNLELIAIRRQAYALRVVEGGSGNLASSFDYSFEYHPVINEISRQGGSSQSGLYTLYLEKGASGTLTVTRQNRVAHESISPSLIGQEIILALQPKTPLRGTVVDTRNVPVARAEFRLDTHSLNPIAITDSEGRFEIESLPLESDVLVIRAPDHVWTKVPVETNGEWTIVLPAGGTITGQVTADGAPVAGKTVAIHVYLPDAHNLDTMAETDAEGHFKFEGVPEGEASIVLPTGLDMETALYGVTHHTVAVEVGKTSRANFTLSSLRGDAQLTGTVRIGGRSATGSIEYRPDRLPAESNAPTASTDESGAYHLEALPTGPGKLTARIQEGDYFREVDCPLTLQAGTNSQDINFPTSSATLLGTLPAGIQSADALQLQLIVETSAGTETIPFQRVLPVQDGFRLGELPAGEATLTAGYDHNGLRRSIHRQILLEQDQTTTVTLPNANAILDLRITGLPFGVSPFIFLLNTAAVPPDPLAMDAAEIGVLAYSDAEFFTDNLPETPIQYLSAGEFTLMVFTTSDPERFGRTGQWPEDTRYLSRPVTLLDGETTAVEIDLE
ncbi:MAG: sigma-70 family RNA polymerase sigma factor [Candidatus Hydrogenedentes bacterium]|nr:sigma-70 family RNA polymerase sigma factor [Candidatus Hydrogenedentota bacterium]